MANNENAQTEPTTDPAQVEADRLAAVMEAEYRAEMDTDWWSPVEQGYYDDDPSPYAGDYSEM